MPAYKDKVRGTWYANFYYTDWMGNKKHKCKRGFKMQREAKEYEREFLETLNRRCDIEFNALATNYFEDMSTRLKPTTIQNKKVLFKHKILPYFEKLKVNEIDTITIRKWQNEIIKNENSPTYIRTINNQLSAILNYAVRHYNLQSNPCKIAGTIGKNSADKDKLTIWTQQDFEKFISFEKKKAAKIAFDILFYTGMRSGELLALCPCDILSNKKINICKNFAIVDGEEVILDPKTPKSKRCISIPDFLYKEITEYVDSLYESDPNERIFYFTRYYLSHEIKRVAKLADLPVIRVHDLRHSHASLLIEMGFDILEISERLGHESVKTTLDTYSHLYPDKDVKLAERLNALR